MQFGFEASFDSIEVVPEQFRVLYKEVDGKFLLDTEDPKVGSVVEGLVALNKSLGASRKEASDHKANAVDLSALSDFGTTPEEIAAGVKVKVEELQGQIANAGDASKNLEALKADMSKATAKEIRGKDKQIEALTGQMHKHLVKDAATKAIVEAKGTLELLMDHVTKRAKVVSENGEFNVVVVDDKGERRYNGLGDLLSIPELVSELKANPTFQVLFEAEKKQGGGTPPGGNNTPVKVGGTEATPKQNISDGLAARGHK